MGLVMAASWLLACNSGDGSNTGEPSPNTPAVQNVNGNLPDTAGTIRLNGTQGVDSVTARDSSNR